MAKIKLGARPKTFVHTITVPMPEGGTAQVQMVYKYRTRSEFGAFGDNLLLAAGATPPASQLLVALTEPSCDAAHLQLLLR